MEFTKHREHRELRGHREIRDYRKPVKPRDNRGHSEQ